MSAGTARPLPWVQEAEDSVLGAMLSSPTAVEECLVLLRPHHFFLDGYRLIFTAMERLHQRGVPLDPITVARELAASHSQPPRRLWANGKPTDQTVQESDLDLIGGEGRVAYFAATVTSTANVAHHAGVVIDAWGKRECIKAFTEPMRGAWNGSTPSTVLREVETALQDLRGRVEGRDETRVVSAQKMADVLEARMKNPTIGTPEGAVPSPFSFLKALQPGRLHVLGGYTADGKTALAVQFVRSAVQAMKRVGLLSIEMSWEDVMGRIAASYGVPSDQVDSGLIGPVYVEAMRHAIGEIARFNLDVIDDSTVDASAISRYQKVGKYDLLVIDHLHRIDVADRKALERQVVQITTLARTARIPILLLAQLHRPFGTDKFPKPTMTSFRETGVIENEAAACWAIWRERDEEGKRSNSAQFLILKNRYGPEGHHKLDFRPSEVRFVEIDHSHHLAP